MMDPASTTSGRSLLDRISPVVMVLRTSLVEESCRKNGLSFIEMLTPFCSFNNIDVPVRTASDHPYRVRRFRLRLLYASEIRQPKIEVAKARLKQLIIHAGDKNISELCSDPPEVDNVLAASDLDVVPSWFQVFNQELVDTVSFSEHEAFDHPVACLVVVSSKDKDPINKFVDLFNTNQLPALLNDGAMDPKILKYFLLLHENEDGMLEKATGILTEMRGSFGANNCRLLCMNSSVNGSEEHQEDPWRDNVSNNQHLGCFLNADDIHELKNSMQDLSSKHIIPHMELKVRVLNQQVSATRKGFRNQIKNLWWRKGKEDVPDNPNGPMYTFSSIESQIRVLGDYAFMLQDYELALSNYRLISTDYKLDRAWKRYAGVQEMMGLAYFLMDQSRKDAEYCMENAFSSYLKIGSSGNATRSGLWWAEMLKARDQYKDAAGVYFRISGEEPLHAAVMLEQAAYCYLLSKPAMLRKYGFHLVLSGDLYKRGDQIKHAIRTYKGALSVLKGSAWSRVRDHVHFQIGKWYAFLGMLDEATKHILEILACGHQSRATQELYLREFFRIIQETGKTIQVSRLQLPVINFPLTQVVFEDHRTYASPAAASVRESLWRSLEEEMIPTFSVMKTNWLESQPKVLPKKYKESNVCVAGEAIKVHVGFRNPLQIPISISNISLICENSVESDDMESGASSSHNYQKDGEQKPVSVSGDYSLNTSLFTLSEVDILIQGGETILVQLTVTPKVEGTLKVVGVRWKLSGSVVGIYNFDSEIGRKKISKGKKKPVQTEKDKLKFLVIKSVPRLQGIISDLPTTVYAGDFRCLTLELRNSSRLSVKNLKMRVSHPTFINIADQEAMDVEFPNCLRKQANSAQGSKKVDGPKAANGVFMFPEATAITQDKPLKWPMWFRAAAAGSYSLYITIYYEMEDTSAIITYRTLRMHYNLEVLPSLEVSFKLSPCPSKLHEFLVRMDVTNRTNSLSFQVHQLSCVGDQWEFLQSIEPSLPSEILMAGQALSCFFKLKKGRTQCTGQGDVSSLSTTSTADVRLSDNDSGGFFDVSSPPLILFHHRERSHQEVPEQENQDTVDFILIYGSQSDGSPRAPGSVGVFTHHTCRYRIMSISPIWWLIDGPQTVRHDFSATFCEINLCMTVYNSSEEVVSVRFRTHDSTPAVTSVGNSSSSVAGSEVGWHDLSHLTDIKVTSDVMAIRGGKPMASESVSPFIWSGSSSTRFNLEPYSSTEIPLQICVFSPGTYDISNYSLNWKFPSSGDGGDDEDGSSQLPGTCQGHSHYIWVLQKE